MTDRELIRAIIEHIEAFSYPPTVAWLAERSGKSTSTIHGRLRTCVRRGFIEVHDGTSRGIRIVKVPE